MRPIVKKSDRTAGWTIIELLTVMSIIVILIGLLVPSLNAVRRYARNVAQRNQFHALASAIAFFNNEYDGYPPSGATDDLDVYYGGAMKLCEAMLGQDLLGFHPDSVFRSDGFDSSGTRDLYPPNPPPDNLAVRREPYLQLESANPYMLGSIYPVTGPFDPCSYVLCDVYTNVTDRGTGRPIGMPLLYYRADISRHAHNLADQDDLDNIYKYGDNHELAGLGMPWNPPPAGPVHKLYIEPRRFYYNTRNYKIWTMSRPCKADSYILISAGVDGEYGTPDDICNFEWQYEPDPLP